jgi:hypothetical protein
MGIERTSEAWEACFVIQKRTNWQQFLSVRKHLIVELDPKTSSAYDCFALSKIVQKSDEYRTPMLSGSLSTISMS